jgi:type VI secretion system protein ImpA
MIDLQSLLSPVSSEEPSGPNLEYDASFQALERIAQFKPEQQMGDTVVPAEEPDWREVGTAAEALLATTKDLRVGNQLCKAELRMNGYVGLAQGLGLMRGLVEQFWPTVHPQLDPDDDNDPTLRVNLLAELCDQGTYLNWLRLAPLVVARGLGSFNLRDVLVASGELPAPANVEGLPDAATLAGAFSGAELDQLRATVAAAREARQHVIDIEALVTDQVGAGQAPNLSKFRAMLDQAIKVLDQQVEQRGGATEGGEVPEGAPGEGGASAPAGRKRLEGEIASREDVLRAIDKMLDYYAKSEPSSPVPVLLQRARRLATMNFMDIIRNLAPDGMSQVETIRGPLEEDGG